MTKKAIGKSNFIWALVLLFIVSCKMNNGSFVPGELTISEGLTNPIGFYDSSPTFSWKLPADVQAQSAYSIVVASSPELLPNKADLWESGRVETDQTLFVKYGGEKLLSKQKGYWQVKFWDNNGEESQWSETAHFELGLLNNSDWQGKWISMPTEQLTEIDERGSVLFRPQYMRKEVNVKSEVQRARLYITAKGVYEAYINGKKVGTDVMSPGWTPNQSISTLTYDVTELLQEGENTLAAVVAEGWRSGRINLRSTPKTIEHTPALLYQLEIQNADGTQIIVSDTSWKVTNQGPIRVAKIYDGETYDANYELGDWNKNGYDDSTWFLVSEQAIADTVLLLPKRYQGVTDQQVLSVQELTEPVEGKPIFNFKQNNVGVPLVKVPMKKGDTLTIRFAEMLNTDGTIYTDNYRSALSTDYFVAAADGVIEWRPTFTFHGYQYIELSGYDPDAKPTKDWVQAVVQHSDFEMNGTFTSSHEKLNQLQSNISWGLRSNFFDVPTDCPQRDERLGWTGDAQVIAPTSIYNADMYAFWAGYLQNVREEQREDGSIPNVIPDVLHGGVSSGWGDVCVIVPWEMYFRTGDVSVLKDNYETMKKWIGFYESRVENNDYIPKIASFCDWLQPYSTPRENYRMTRRGDTPPDLANTAYFARAVELTMRSALVLGKTEEAKELQSLHKAIKEAFENKFFDAEGRTTITKETQTAYLLAVEFGLLSEENVPKAIAHLKRVIEACDGHLQTGFLGTPILPFVLDKAGEIDLMYAILFKETYPSWFYSINNGATTMWERWDSYTIKDGFHKDGMNSFNHYAYGAIGQWMYERIAGIKPVKAGYKEIEIAPMPGGPLRSVSASYNSPYGKISSSWKLENGTFELEAIVPPNTTAKITIPANPSENLLLNGSAFVDQPNLQLVSKSGNGFELLAKPGTYKFVSKYN
ncbi:family 78 glycoside hydrolase catalytic domain [Mangrovibacterium sp.]|uniref:family 78 glycoside hydrolase catalytic domain n=1 Tax=Mangrovibacterium sp. TaxID=1961364 RepID=UPI0035635508